MKKFSYISENKTTKKSQLQIGIEIEKEHTDVYNYFKKYLDRKNVDMPLSETEFYKMIAQAHLRELSDYYDRLSKMEKE